MLSDRVAARRRIQRFLESAIAPQRLQPLGDLSVSVYRPAAQCSFREAAQAEYQPVELGYHFGPMWVTAWFRMLGEVPADVDVSQLVAVIDTNTEACLWNGDVPYHGLSEFHRVVPLAAEMVHGQRVELFVEAAANQLWGADHFKGRYSQEPIGMLREARLARRLASVDQLYHDLNFVLALYDTMPDDSPRAKKLLYAMNDAINVLDPGALETSAEAGQARLQSVITTHATESASHCHAIGHAHIDTAWLWRLRETRRKCYRTFSTALRNMERYAEYRFQQGQAQLYAFVEEDHPALFEQIKARINGGEWEVGGALWVEPDCNLVSGESLVRQILHGTRYFKEKFGVDQNYLWLPDTFGYNAAMPQILRQAGIGTFFTQKMSWNEVNKFPHHTFWWAGLDGTPVLAHFLTSDTYNSDCSPKQLSESDRLFKQGDRCSDWLYAFGWGDGGGGPTEEMLESLRRAADCEGLPRVQQSRIVDFVDVLHQQKEHLPTWDGELYLETHRGTLTTQAANKRDNRRAELQLRDVEMLYALAPDGVANYPSAVLDATWKTVLLNQFHDILPGSSIHEVYEDSERDYATVFANLRELRGTALQAWANAADTSEAKQPIVAINTLGWQRSEVTALPAGAAPAVQTQRGVQIEGDDTVLGLLPDVSALGHSVFDLAALPAVASEAAVRVTKRSLENQWLHLELDELGRIVSLIDRRVGREVLAPGEIANDLALYEDRPFVNDAWDIDSCYLEKRLPLPDEASIRVVEEGPLRGALRVERAIGMHSRLVQDIRLSCTSARIDFDTWIDWHTDHELLRVLFPVDVRSDIASYHAQFGRHRRPTHFNTSWDRAKYECAGHHWCDLSEPDYGVALLSDCKYGYSCHQNTLGMSLLRSPRYPDPKADRGTHRLTYSLLPHLGDLPQSDVWRQGYQLNVPLLLQTTSSHPGSRGAQFQTLCCDRPNMMIDTVKKAESDQRLIVRLVEAFGQRGLSTLSWDASLGTAAPVDLFENESDHALFVAESSESGRFTWRHRPFGLYSLAIGTR